ncbi:MAG: hypothetical protein RIK87_00180 [Fuerstiella sp.]
MSSIEPTKANRFRWLLAAAIGLIIVALTALASYPHWQAQQWKEELQTTSDSWEAVDVVGKLLHVKTPYADAVLTELSEDNQKVVFASEHRVVLLLDAQTGQPYSVTPWSSDNMSPNITAKFVNPRIVENIPEAVTIAVTDEVNGSTCLFVFTYKHNGSVCNLSAEELIEFQRNGYWKEYVARKGDPVAQKRPTWIQPEVESWQRWKASVEAAFGAQGAHPKVPQSF